MTNRKQLSSLQTAFLSRGLRLAKTSLKIGALAAEQAVRSRLGDSPSQKDVNARLLTQQIEILTEELGQLKGSVMKVGQLISIYGEHFLPEEANRILKSLQFQSPTLAWDKVKAQIEKELGAKTLEALEIQETPWAAASIGQVHRARIKSTGEEIALKVQYPGIDTAIETDLKFLKTILSMGPLLPSGPRFHQIFDEVREMLYREVDYRLEIETTARFGEYLKEDARYLVPKVYPEFSSQRILATEFIDGVNLDGREVLGLSQEERNALGEAYLDLYIRELLDFKEVQTDPHFGNYKFIRRSDASRSGKIVLLDFGAVRDAPDDFLFHYKKVMTGGLLRDRSLIESGGRGLGLLKPEDPLELVDHYVNLCLLITEPFASDEPYDWGSSDLPKRVAKKGAEIAFGFHLRAPPRETIFLDRKLSGAFIVLSKLGVKASFRGLLMGRLGLQ